ncbi:Fumarylacetoacetase [Pseudocohnilembus persalinus]|uniref:Fumarylacetoacetase n=1 Tax=Pseudocohnilembus persalinus TaxID=266149 RepID=A0A0V0R666_PSEPJ|nr:Fumarylacetoacetase [Pseudocohnilembus persalinus]|eukprot:KRX09963.1 Fumarylacetoacetase [Pseudocohnilembus persalinus]
MSQKIFQQTVQQFQAPKIIGLALNYGKSSSNNKSKLKEPVFFTKTLNCLTTETFPNSKIVKLPIAEHLQQNQLNHELELGFVIGQKGRNISLDQCERFIGGYFLCQDITDATHFGELRNRALSWELAKCRDYFLPVGEFIEKEKLGDVYDEVELELKINGEQFYKTSTQDMVFNLYEQISYISKFITLNPGDLILSGTPQPAPFKNTDLLEGYLYKNGQIISELLVKPEIQE